MKITMSRFAAILAVALGCASLSAVAQDRGEFRIGGGCAGLGIGVYRAVPRCPPGRPKGTERPRGGQRPRWG